jgi:hypothetical protein
LKAPDGKPVLFCFSMGIKHLAFDIWRRIGSVFRHADNEQYGLNASVSGVVKNKTGRSFSLPVFYFYPRVVITSVCEALLSYSRVRL